MWMERPLSPLLVRYAADDARLILELWRRICHGSPADSVVGLPVDLALAYSLSQLQVGG